LRLCWGANAFQAFACVWAWGNALAAEVAVVIVSEASSMQGKLRDVLWKASESRTSLKGSCHSFCHNWTEAWADTMDGNGCIVPACVELMVTKHTVDVRAGRISSRMALLPVHLRMFILPRGYLAVAMRNDDADGCHCSSSARLAGSIRWTAVRSLGKSDATH
jgi:hypothetical protein